MAFFAHLCPHGSPFVSCLHCLLRQVSEQQDRIRELETILRVGLNLHLEECTDESDCTFVQHAREALKGKTP